MRDALHLSHGCGAARRIDLHAVHTYLSTRSGVAEVHDLHVWGMSTSEAALTVHFVAPTVEPARRCDSGTPSATSCGRKFGIRHTTLQVEFDKAAGAPAALSLSSARRAIVASSGNNFFLEDSLCSSMSGNGLGTS